jgi:hypothetical protein
MPSHAPCPRRQPVSVVMTQGLPAVALALGGRVGARLTGRLARPEEPVNACCG